MDLTILIQGPLHTNLFNLYLFMLNMARSFYLRGNLMTLTRIIYCKNYTEEEKFPGISNLGTFDRLTVLSKNLEI